MNWANTGSRDVYKILVCNEQMLHHHELGQYKQ